MAIAFFDTEGFIVESNDAFLDMLGVTRNELNMEKVRWDVYTPKEWMPRTLQAIEEFKQTGYIRPYEKQFYHTSGKLHWGIFSGATLSDGNTGVSYVIDITERKMAEEALRQSEEKYRSLFENADEGFCLMELIPNEQGLIDNMVYLETNQSYARLTGASDVVGRSTKEVLPNLEQQWWDVINRVYQTGLSERIENEAVDFNRWFSVHFSGVGNKAEKRLSLVFDDITERKRFEQRQSFLLKFSDALRIVSDADSIAVIAVKLLAEQLHLDRCYIVVRRPEEDLWDIGAEFRVAALPPMPIVLDQRDFPGSLRIINEETLVFNNTNELPALTEMEKKGLQALGFGGLVMGVLRSGDKNPSWAMVAASVEPRQWTTGEVALVQEVAERTWAAVKRARVEESLRESEEKYRNLFNSIDEGFYQCEVIFDENNKPVDILYITENPAAIRMIGQSYLGRRLRDINPTYEEYWYQIWGEVALTGISTRQERYSQADNMWFDFYLSKVEGKDRQVAVLFSDITERKRQEDALRKSEERLQLATTATKTGTFIYYPQEDRGEPDREMLILFGLPLDGKLNLSEALGHIIHPDDRTFYFNEVTKSLDPTGDGKLDADIRIVHPDGSLRWVHVTAQTYFEGNPLQAVKMPGVAVDITERKRLEQQKDEFIAIASHELKTPVTSIKIYSEILQENFEQSNNQKDAELVKKLSTQIDRLNEFVAELLDTTKVEKDKLLLNKADFNLNELARKLTEEMQQLTMIHQLRFHTTANGNVHADKEGITRVLSNLISNAIKYSPRGGEIMVSIVDEDDHAKVTVKDSGLGISSDSLKKIFDRFFRGDNPQVQTYPGMGLGLYISAGIIKKHGGTIYAESKENEGSAFYFTLPYKTA